MALALRHWKLLLALLWLLQWVGEGAARNATAAGERRALLEFKAGAGAAAQEALRSWQEGGGGDGHCGGGWRGVSCSADGRVVRLVLDNLQLRGSMEPLARLHRLRWLSLQDNNISGILPDLRRCLRLRRLYLSRNAISGPIPSSISALPHLRRLLLSDNLLSGPIPPSLSNLSNLLALSLQNNSFSGTLPDLRLANLSTFNVSFNLRLSGLVPPSLSAFPSSSFLGDSNLCGNPLPPCQVLAEPDGGAGAAAVVTSTPASPPREKGNHRHTARLGTAPLIAIVVGDVAVVVAIVCCIVVYYFGRKYDRPEDQEERGKKQRSDDETGHGAAKAGESGKGKLVFVGERRDLASEERFEMEDLLRASAEMLGKGTLGAAYKAVMEGGAVIVAVKRLKSGGGGGGGCGGDFEQLMEIVGNLSHPNVVRLRAYYSAADEKLLVYDYMPCGNLYTLLHGNRGPGRVPLDWTTRVKIALGAARGLAYIHHHWKAQKLPHGNIKSTNVLLDREGNACISDFGLAIWAHSCGMPNTLVGYRAPEHDETRSMSQKGDVYSFGVLLLEILTGKAPMQLSYARDEGFDLPKWVQSVVQEEWTSEVFDLELLRYKNIEEEMVRMLQIAMQCVTQVAEERPEMKQVVKMMEGIVKEKEMGEDEEESGETTMSRSASVSEDTGGTTSH